MTRVIKAQYVQDDEFPQSPNFGPSFGTYLSNTEVLQPDPVRTSSVEERQALRTLWYCLNNIAARFDCLRLSARSAHFVVKLVDNVKRHDCELDKEVSDKLRMFFGMTLHQSAVLNSQALFCEAIERLDQAKFKLNGKLRKEQKVRLEDRLQRYLDEGTRIIHVMDEIVQEFNLPNQPFSVRRQVLTELLLSLESMLDLVTSMRKKLDGLPVLLAWDRQIRCNEADLRNWRKQIKKWRDNPTQRFKNKVKICTFDLVRICHDLADLREECYQECLIVGMSFNDRCHKLRQIVPNRLKPVRGE